MRRTLVALLSFFSSVAAAETIVVRQVQILRTDGVARRATQADGIGRSLATGQWQPPDEGQGERFEADADGWVRTNALFGGYAYAKVEMDEDRTWILEGMGYSRVYVNGELRVGNIYGHKDTWESWEPASDYSYVPVQLHKGPNHLLFRGNRHGLLRARLHSSQNELQLNAKDVTYPDLVVGQAPNTWAAVVVLNATDEPVTDARLEVELEGADPVATPIPVLPPLGVRKVAVPVRGSASMEVGPRALRIALFRGDQFIEEETLTLQVKLGSANRRVTFRSKIDDSVQYYGYVPATGDGPSAFVLSLHGASVEAINQSASYAPLEWAHILAPTNRRPFGFSWEDWGRLDALETLELGLGQLDIDTDRVYLTGHSMGGHGTWHVGSLYPDRFAAVGPSAGWISVWSYRQEPPQDTVTNLSELVERATLPSRTLQIVPNLEGTGIYVLHGSEDDNVPPEQSYLVLDELQTFHRDYIYHEEPNVGHWWDLSDAPGADCVSWAPMFDFFTRHRSPTNEEVRELRFRTPSPSVSAWNYWAGIFAQQRQFEMSSIDLRLDPLAGTLSGATSNVATLVLDLAHVDSDQLLVNLDGNTVTAAIPANKRVWLRRGVEWKSASRPDPAHKNPKRAGTFREAFANRTQLVYATGGTPEENAWALAKARYDAEFLWYQGNASVDVVPDTLFDPAAEPERNVLLYGNADNHAHWAALWEGPVEVGRGRARIDGRGLEGDGIGILAVRPRPGSNRATVGIVAGTGLAGSRLLDDRPYLRLGVSYPDVTVFQDRGDQNIVLGAGWFGNDWSVAHGEFVWTP